MNVHCQIWEADNTLKVYLGETLIANVHEGPLGPTVYPVGESRHCWTFNDMSILMDNWNEMQDIRSTVTSAVFEIECPHCKVFNKPEMGPDKRSAICNWCDTPFNIGGEQ